MAEVISLSAVREERAPHWEGTCVCLGCKHEWHGVGPIGVTQLDCPQCELPKGVVKYPFGAQPGDLLFECTCGSEALTAYTRTGRFWLRCMACGIDHTEAVFG
jgi:hypothetical protein